MKIIKQICLILLFYIIGDIISLGLKTIFPSLFLPGTIIGMILLLIALFTKFIKTEQVYEVGSFLTSNMAFFFIPAAVGVVEYFDILEVAIIKIIIIAVVSVIVSFFSIVYSIKLTIYLQNKLRRNNDE